MGEKLSLEKYNALDLAATDMIFRRMSQEGALEGSAFDHAMLGPAMTMGLRGIRIDERRRNHLIVECLAEAGRHWEVLRKAGLQRGQSIAPSAIALQGLLYGKMHCPVQFSREGAPTCGREALQAILEHQKTPEEAVPIVQAALELRRLEEDRKVLSKSLGADGRMHTGFGVAATVTSRWSSSRDPFNEGANLHALSRRVRQVFIPDPGYVFWNFDLRQAESYCVAHLAESQWYIDAHNSGNVHALVGGKIWPEQFKKGAKSAKASPLPWAPDSSYYDLAKRTQHGFNYMLGAAGFARQSKMPKADAAELREDYFALVPEIRAWHRWVANELKTKHKLWTPMGRSRTFLGRPWEDCVLREAVAFVPQSTISDINKIILWRIWRLLEPRGVQVLLEVHDSVLCQIPEANLDAAREAFALTRVEVPVGDRLMVIAEESARGQNWGGYDAERNPGGLKEFQLY